MSVNSNEGEIVWAAIVSCRDIQNFRELLEDSYDCDGINHPVQKINDTQAAIPLSKDCIAFLNKVAVDSEDGKLFQGINFKIHQLSLSIKRRKKYNPSENLKESLKALLKENGYSEAEFLNDIPNSWERHGNLILLPVSSFCSSIWETLGSKVWDIVASSLKCKEVAKKIKVNNDDFRTPQVQILKGDSSWVVHIDNGIKYTYDITKCMFSAGNITEKLRIASFNCKGETVVDLYAGIGYFTLPYLVHAKASLVHACEWNPAAIEALEKNLVLNGVKEKCILHYGDNRKVCPVGVADRVNLGLIPSSEDGWGVACYALKPATGGILHIHGNVTSNSFNALQSESLLGYNCSSKSNEEISQKQLNSEITDTYFRYSETSSLTENKNTCKKHKRCKPEWKQWAKDIAETVSKILLTIHKKKWTIHILHVEHVKAYAPHIDHIVVDVSCKPGRED